MYISIYHHIDVTVYAYYPERARGCSLALTPDEMSMRLNYLSLQTGGCI